MPQNTSVQLDEVIKENVSSPNRRGTFGLYLGRKGLEQQNERKHPLSDSWSQIICRFLIQAHEDNLKTASYPREWLGLGTSVSFGMGMPARIPWIALTTERMAVSEGIYPVYLYYKDLQTLVLAYGISETREAQETWPAEIFSISKTIEEYFGQKVARYGNSFVFKAYKVAINDDTPSITYAENGQIATSIDLDSDLSKIVKYYTNVLSLPQSDHVANAGALGARFHMEKQLEDFLVHNWNNTELGKKYDLIIEEGELLSQQYKTDIGPIDILAKDKSINGYVVIELKRNQTSDDTVEQVARYIGWVRRHLKADNVKGVIIAGQYDQKLDYALEAIENVEVFIYEVNFILKEFHK